MTNLSQTDDFASLGDSLDVELNGGDTSHTSVHKTGRINAKNPPQNSSPKVGDPAPTAPAPESPVQSIDKVLQNGSYKGHTVKDALAKETTKQRSSASNVLYEMRKDMTQRLETMKSNELQVRAQREIRVSAIKDRFATVITTLRTQITAHLEQIALLNSQVEQNEQRSRDELYSVNSDFSEELRAIGVMVETLQMSLDNLTRND